MVHRKEERRLPVQQLLVLSIARFAEPIAMTSVFPYLPEMIESLGVQPDEVAKWTGITAAVFSLAQAIFAVPWGRFSDRAGRKIAIMCCLTGTMIMTVVWGLSRTLWMAVLARCLQGIFNGNVGIIRTTVAEMVPYKELQPRAFSVMPLVWNIGSIFGPMLGGALANPKGIIPGRPLPDDMDLLDTFPYLLPNLVAAALFFVGITTGILFLDESLETRRGSRDIGREYGRLLTHHLRKLALYVDAKLRRRGPEHERLLDSSNNSSNTRDTTNIIITERKGPIEAPPRMSECLNRQSVLNLVCYTLLATHNLAFDSLIPNFLYYREHDHSSSNPDFVPPFKFNGGYGLDRGTIGLLFTLYGVSGMIIQFFIFPPVARKYGVVKCLRFCSIGMPIVYFFVPFTSLMPDRRGKIITGFALMLAKGFFSTFAFPCSTILFTNSAPSLRILGTLNGIAVSVSAVGRAVGPAIAGAAFTVGVERGWMIAPWWLMSFIAILAAGPVFFIVEGKGFGGDDGEIEDSDAEEDEEEGEEDSTLNRSGIIDTAMHAGADIEETQQEEEGYGSVGVLLSRTNTVTSNPFSEASDDVEQGIATAPSSSRRGSRRMSIPHRKVSRKVSIPLGMGSVSRRYSSNLGQSYGSASGFA